MHRIEDPGKHVGRSSAGGNVVVIWGSNQKNVTTNGHMLSLSHTQGSTYSGRTRTTGGTRVDQRDDSNAAQSGITKAHDLSGTTAFDGATLLGRRQGESPTRRKGIMFIMVHKECG